MASIVAGVMILCATSLFFAFVFGFFAYLRYLKHKETMALAEKGLLQPETVTPGYQLDSSVVRWGIILIALGVALSIGLYPIGWLAMPGRLPLGFGPWMIVGLLPLFFGVALLIIHFLPALHVLVRQDLVPKPNTPADPARPEQIDESAALPTPVPLTTPPEEQKRPDC